MADSLAMMLENERHATGDLDEVLVERFGRGDSGAYDAIVRKYQSQVAGLTHRLLGWPGDVDDVVQEVFLSALRGLPAFRGQSSLSTWLTRITINKCRSYRRRWLLSPRRWFVGTPPHDDPAQASSAAPAADRPMMDREKAERVRRVINRLPAQYREVIVLRYLEQMSIEDASEALSARPATIQVRLHRARKLLRDSLADLMED